MMYEDDSSEGLGEEFGDFKGNRTVSDNVVQVELVSFGFSFGQPKDTLKTYNLRSLPNPSKEIRKTSTGLHKQLQEQLFSIPDVITFFDATIEELTNLLLTSNVSENISIGFGCHAGKHRSVAVVERVFSNLAKHENLKHFTFTVTHRDIERSSKESKKDHRRK